MTTNLFSSFSCYALQGMQRKPRSRDALGRTFGGQGCKNFRRGQGIYGLFSGIYPCRGGKSELRFLKENRREKAVLKTKITSQKFPNSVSADRKRTNQGIIAFLKI